MNSLKSRRYLVFGIALVVLIVAAVYGFMNREGVILSLDSDDQNYDGLRLEREVDMTEDVRFTFQNRVDVFTAALAAHESVDSEHLDLYTLAASDANILGDLVATREWYEEYLQHIPTDYVVWNNYALVLERMYDFAAAEEAYITAYQIVPQQEYLRDLIRFIEEYDETGERAEEVRALYEQSVQDHGQLRWNMVGLAQWYLEQDDCQRAIDHYEIAEKIDPENASIQRELEEAREVCRNQ